jgi:5,10-methenyltetrahydromethanopterin hydrogenase
MATVTICDRCKAPAGPGAARTFVLPADLPSTLPVTKPTELTISLTSPQDLCLPCQASALAEFALAWIGPGVLTPDALTLLLTRLAGGLIVTPTVTPVMVTKPPTPELA